MSSRAQLLAGVILLTHALAPALGATTPTSLSMQQHMPRPSTTTQAQHQKPSSAFETSHPSHPSQTTTNPALPTNPASLPSSHAVAENVLHKPAVFAEADLTQSDAHKSDVFAEADLTQSDALKLQQLGWQLGRRGVSVTSPSEALPGSDGHMSNLASSRQALQSFWARVADLSWVLSWHPWAILYKQQSAPQEQLTHYKLYKSASQSSLAQDLQQVSDIKQEPETVVDIKRSNNGQSDLSSQSMDEDADNSFASQILRDANSDLHGAAVDSGSLSSTAQDNAGVRDSFVDDLKAQFTDEQTPFSMAMDDDMPEGASIQPNQHAQQADSRDSMLHFPHIPQKPLQTWPRQDLPEPLAHPLAQTWQDGEPQHVGAALSKAKQDFAKWMSNARPHANHAGHVQEQQAATLSSNAQQAFVDQMQQQKAAVSGRGTEQSYSDFLQQQVSAARTAEQKYRGQQDKNGFPYLASDASNQHLQYASLGD